MAAQNALIRPTVNNHPIRFTARVESMLQPTQFADGIRKDQEYLVTKPRPVIITVQTVARVYALMTSSSGKIAATPVSYRLASSVTTISSSGRPASVSHAAKRPWLRCGVCLAILRLP